VVKRRHLDLIESKGEKTNTKVNTNYSTAVAL
jgi:hypothetical protein